MAKKVSLPPVGPGSTVRVPTRSRWLVFAAIAVGLGVGAAWFLHRSPDQRPARYGLPARPDLPAYPAELRAAVAAAEARVMAERGASAALTELARLYHANHFIREAAVCWQLLRVMEPQTARWSYYLADLSRMAGNEDGLRTGLEQTAQLAPDYAPAWLQQADLAFKTARLDAAANAYRRRLELLPGDPYAMLGLARVALQQGRREEGLAQIVDLVRRVPDFSSGHNLYAELLAQAGDESGAAEQRRLGSSVGRFRAAADPWLEELRSACFDVERLIEWGEIDLQTRHGDRGKAMFERVVRLAPENPRGYERLGAHYLAVNEPARAVETLEHGSRLPDASERLFGQLCDAYHAQRDPAGELRAAEAGLRRHPQASTLHNGRGHALAGLGRLDEAMAAYQQAITLAPFAADPVVNLGDVLLQAGRLAEAKAAFKQALGLQPMYPKAVVLLASLELDEGELASAAPRIHALFNADPASPGARALMSGLYLKQAMAAFRRQDVAGVERACRDGLALVPDSADLAGLLGALYLQHDRLPEAVKMLEVAHTLRPEDPRITLSLGEVQARLGRFDEARRLLTEAGRQAREIGAPELVVRGEAMLRKLPAP